MDISTTGAGSALIPAKTEQDTGFQGFGKDGFTFFDFLDIINPLQHIPIVNTAYRSMTGDEIDPASKIIGGSLFGGPIGGVAAVADVAIEEATGKDVGQHALALFDGEETEQIASLDTNKPPGNSALAFAPGPGVDISQWAANAGTGGIDWRDNLKSQWDNAQTSPQQVAELSTQAAAAPITSAQLNSQPAQQTSPQSVQMSNLAALQALSADLKQARATQLVSNYGAIQGDSTRPSTNEPTEAYGRAAQKNDNGMGWFSDKMKAGIEKYQAAGQLKTALN
ncbi:MAG: hypothetical protein OQK35_00500 [Alphaproteobacteria bacterium]|nr:hypothetical protein [Alphaproteobacteria bacterium]